jgi:hypothetical protein
MLRPRDEVFTSEGAIIKIYRIGDTPWAAWFYIFIIGKSGCAVVFYSRTMEISPSYLIYTYRRNNDSSYLCLTGGY